MANYTDVASTQRAVAGSTEGQARRTPSTGGFFAYRSPSFRICLPERGFMPALASVMFALMALVPLSHAQTGACVDTDGDGWGWNGVASCLVGSSDNSQSQSTNACIDSDGDGWGWNGTSSCLVSGQGDGDSGSSDSGSSDSGAGTSGACVDSDGDGWGWDGQSSCRTGSDSGGAGDNGGTDGNDNGNNVTISGSFDRSRDLVALHFDHAPDPDDGHAAAAGYIVSQELNLDVIVVGGAYGVWNAGRYVSASEGLMTSIWGNQWLDAHNNRSSAVAVATSRWAATLAAGGDVWIAEGGQSDFTAAVVRSIQQQFPEFQTTSRIHLIQHSQWNEDHANASDLSFVKSNTRYVRIEDGNNPNSTADFRSETPDSFVSTARSTRYAGVWNSAFSYLSPYEKLDFSDSVELMHILGIGTGTIATVEQFADRFMR